MRGHRAPGSTSDVCNSVRFDQHLGRHLRAAADEPSTRRSRPTASTGAGTAPTTSPCSRRAVARTGSRRTPSRSARRSTSDAIHQTKSEIFQNTLATTELTPRPGVVDTMEAARDDGVKLALVTSTSETNVESLLAGLRSSIDRHAFEAVLTATEVEQTQARQGCLRPRPGATGRGGGRLRRDRGQPRRRGVRDRGRRERGRLPQREHRRPLVRARHEPGREVGVHRAAQRDQPPLSSHRPSSGTPTSSPSQRTKRVPACPA